MFFFNTQLISFIYFLFRFAFSRLKNNKFNHDSVLHIVKKEENIVCKVIRKRKRLFAVVNYFVMKNEFSPFLLLLIRFGKVNLDKNKLLRLAATEVNNVLACMLIR